MWVQWHFSVWRLILNLEKTSIVCNQVARDEYREELRDVPVRTAESQVYLGIEAGSDPRNHKAQEREQVAQR